MRKTLYTIVLGMVLASASAQVSQQLNHHLYNPVPLNPAATGYHDALNVTLAHGQWWNSFEGTPVSRNLSVHSPLKGTGLSLGMLLMHEKIGVSRSMSVTANAAYSVALRSGKLSFGLRGGFLNQVDRWSEVVVNDIQDASFSMGNQQAWLPEAGAGAYYKTKKWYSGIALPSFFQRTYDSGGAYKQDFNPAQFTYVWHSGMLIDIHEQWSLQPALLVLVNSGSRSLVDMAMMVNYSEIFGVGGSIRPGDSWTAMLRVFAVDQLSFVYSYERFYSRVSNFDNGSHEITISYDLVKNSKAPDTRFF